MDKRQIVDDVSSVVISQTAGHVYLYTRHSDGTQECYIVVGYVESDYHGHISVSAKVDDWNPDSYDYSDES